MVNRFLSETRIRVELSKQIRRSVFVCMVQRRLVTAVDSSRHPDRCPELILDTLRRLVVHHQQKWIHQHWSHVIFADESRVILYHADCNFWIQQSTTLTITRRNIRARPLTFYGVTLDSSANMRWEQCRWFQFGASVPTCGSVDDGQDFVWGICLDVLNDITRLMKIFGQCR